MVRSRNTTKATTGRAVVDVGPASQAGVARYLVSTLPFLPAVLYRRYDNPVKVFGDHSANKVYRNVVFDSLELGIVDARFLDQEFRPLVVERGSHRLKSQHRLSRETVGYFVGLVNDAVLCGLDAPFGAPLALVRQDGPTKVSKTGRVFLSAKICHLHNSAVIFVVGNHNETSEATMNQVPAVIVIGCGGGRDITFVTPVTSSTRLAPQDFEYLRTVSVTKMIG
jgi:hypothetical protein